MFPVTFPTNKGFVNTLTALWNRLGISTDYYEELTTSNAAAVDVNLDFGVVNLTTDGTGNAGQVVDIANGTRLGQSLVVKMGNRANAADTAVINANTDQTTITFDANDEEVLLEFNGAIWVLVYNLNATAV